DQQWYAHREACSEQGDAGDRERVPSRSATEDARAPAGFGVRQLLAWREREAQPRRERGQPEASADAERDGPSDAPRAARLRGCAAWFRRRRVGRGRRCRRGRPHLRVEGDDELQCRLGPAAVAQAGIASFATARDDGEIGLEHRSIFGEPTLALIEGGRRNREGLEIRRVGLLDVLRALFARAFVL